MWCLAQRLGRGGTFRRACVTATGTACRPACTCHRLTCHRDRRPEPCARPDAMRPLNARRVPRFGSERGLRSVFRRSAFDAGSRRVSGRTSPQGKRAYSTASKHRDAVDQDERPGASHQTQAEPTGKECEQRYCRTSTNSIMPAAFPWHCSGRARFVPDRPTRSEVVPCDRRSRHARPTRLGRANCWRRRALPRGPDCSDNHTDALSGHPVVRRPTLHLTTDPNSGTVIDALCRPATRR